MGSRQSKLEDGGELVPSTPVLEKHEPITTDFDCLHCLDPRSPNICRTTPLNAIIENQKRKTSIQVPCQKSSSMENTSKCNILKKKFLKGFSNSNDPRSPSLLLNRTPIVFENENSFNLDDTFSDLFVVNTDPYSLESMNNSERNDSEFEINVEEAIPSINLTLEIAKDEETLDQVLECDPRSPTIGVDRTPIILSNGELNENNMIENVLQQLSLIEPQTKPYNKPLEKIKNNKPQVNNRKTLKNHIYEDADHQIYSTPKSRKIYECSSIGKDSPIQSKRTPLKCVANKSYGHSKSVDNSAKSGKTDLLLKSYDDNNLGVEKLKKKICFGIENVSNS